MPVIKSKSSVVPDKYAKLTMMEYAWHSPAFFQPGDADLDVLSQVLGRQGTGRLFKRLVLKEQLAQRVSVSQQSSQHSSVFKVSVQLKPNARVEKVRKIVDEEIAAVLKNGVSTAELNRAKVSLESSYIWGLEGLMARGETLQRYNHYTSDPGYIAKDLGRYKAVTSDSMKQIGKKYLRSDRQVTLITVPKTGESK